MKKKDNLIIVILFASVLLVLAIGSLFLKDKDFSENENRMLQQMPKLAASDIFSGYFEEAFQRYEDDQIIGRNGFIALKSTIKTALGSKESNGVYIGKDGYLIEKIPQEVINEQPFNENLSALNDFFAGLSESIEKAVMIVPTSGYVNKDKLPALAYQFDEKALAKRAKNRLSEYNYVDLYEGFSQRSSEELYYKTDHHWTSLGAYKAYQIYEKTLGITPTVENYKVTVGSENFLGSMFSKVLIMNPKRDRVELYENTNFHFKVKADGKNIGGIFQEKCLKEKDKYAVFLGGNYGKVEIKGGPKNGRKLLIIKDSFANSFAQFVAGDCEEVYMVDLRYFRGNLDNYIKERGINRVLVLYSMTNIAGDKNISMLNNKGDLLN